MAINTGDLPQFSASTYSSSLVDTTNTGLGTAKVLQQMALSDAADTATIRARRILFDKSAPVPQEQAVPLRLVQVFIADTNENLPLDNRMVYRGNQHLTDLTDQELFYEIDIATLLKNHNAVRTKTIDKRVKDRTEYLEPARVRDLKMNVVTIASF